MKGTQDEAADEACRAAAGGASISNVHRESTASGASGSISNARRGIFKYSCNDCTGTAVCGQVPPHVIAQTAGRNS